MTTFPINTRIFSMAAGSSTEGTVIDTDTTGRMLIQWDGSNARRWSAPANRFTDNEAIFTEWLISWRRREGLSDDGMTRIHKSPRSRR